MIRLVTKERKLILHSAHQGVGVSMIAQSQRSDRRLISPLLIDVFSKPSEQSLVCRLIDRVMSFNPEANWLLQAHLDRGQHDIDPLDESNCVVILGGEEPFSAALLAQLRIYAKRGGALVALNAGAQTTPDWREFASKTLGANFSEATPASEKLTLRIAAGKHYHPVVQGVSAWKADRARFPTLDSRAVVLLEGIHGEEKHPLAWGLDGGWDRIFSTTLGTPEDFMQPSFFRLIWNALFWTMRMT